MQSVVAQHKWIPSKESLGNWLYYLLIAAVASYLIFPYAPIRDIPFSMNGAIFIFVLAAHVFFRPQHIPQSIRTPYLLFLIPLVLTILFSLSVNSLFALKPIATGMIAAVLIATYIRNGERMRRAMMLLIPIAIIQGLLEILSALLPANRFPFLSWIPGSQEIMGWGSMGNVVVYGMTLVGAGIGLLSYPEKPERKRNIHLLLFLIVVSVILTGSRAVWSAFSVSTAMFLLLRKQPARIGVVAAMLVIAWIGTPPAIEFSRTLFGPEETITAPEKSSSKETQIQR